MKKVFLMALVVMASASFNVAFAAKKKKKDNGKQPVVAPVVLATSSDSLSYVAGKSMTNGLLPFLKQQHGIDSTGMADFVRGLKDMLDAGDDPKIKAYSAGMSIGAQLKGQMLASMKKEFEDTPDSIVDAFVFRGFVDALNGDTAVFSQDNAENLFRIKREADRKAKEEKLYGANRDAGRDFLASNARKDSVVTLPSGLQYKVLVKGEGEVPQRTDKVLVNYEGRLVDGTVFDSSSRHGSKPASFRADQVIKGWTEALTMMPVGSKWQLFIPYELAYGERGAGQQIKPYSALVFDVELGGIDKPKTEEVKATDDVKTAKKSVPAKKPVPARKKAARK